MNLDLKKSTKNVAKIILYPFMSLVFLCMRHKKYQIIDDELTIMKVIHEGYSISRFGDGEFLWILGKNKKSFQDNSEKMSNELKAILQDYKLNNRKVLLGIYGTLNDLSKHTYKSKVFWKYFLIKYGKQVYNFLPDDVVYCDTAITRPYMDYKNKNFNVMRKKFDNLKKLWNNRDVIIVEGEYTRLGIGNDLFDNCKSIKRIICPPKNAYYKYEDIAESIRRNADKKSLVLMSLGPTATILSYNMSKEGYQCIDTGHIDIEYMWFKNGATKKENIVGKYVNEVKKEKPDDINDDKYFSQILETISL